MATVTFLTVSIAVCFVGYAIGRIGTRGLTSTDSTRTTSRFRGLVTGWSAVATVTLVGTTAVTGLPEVVSVALAPTIPAVIGRTFGWLLTVPIAVLATASTYYGGFAVLEQVRGSTLDRTTATLAATRTLWIHAVIFSVPVALAVAVADSGSNLGIAGVVIATIPIGSYLGGSILASTSVSAREPDDDERRRLADATKNTPLSEMTWQVVEGAFGTDSKVVVVGPTGFRRLYVSEQFFEQPPAAFEAVFAVRAERERLSHRGIAAVVLSLKVLLGIVLVGFLLKLLPVRPTPLNVMVGLPTGIAIAVALDWLSWRVTYRADRRAANRVGIERLSESLRELAERNDIDTEPSRLVQHLRSRPSLSRRLSKVRDEY